MRVIDETYLAFPFFGRRQRTNWLRAQGERVNRKRVRRLMRIMGLESLSPKPKLSVADRAHPVYPYLLRDLAARRGSAHVRWLHSLRPCNLQVPRIEQRTAERQPASG